MTNLPPLRLNPALDPAPYAAEYAAKQFVQIPNILEPSAAEAVLNLLKTNTPYRFVYADPDVEGGVVQLSPADLQAIGPQGMNERMKKVMERATQSFGFCYNVYQMNNALAAGNDAGHPIHDLTRFLQSQSFLDFGAAIIGETGINASEAQATNYSRGSFLTRHVDNGMRNERRAAFTFGFTKDWMTDWGGLLMFLDPNQDISQAHMPRFNTLTLFNGHAIHSVSAVSAFAGAPRLSIAGWLRSD